MKKQLFLFIAVFFIGFAVNAQNKMDEAGKRHGLWKGIYETSQRPRYEGTFSHGKETGTFKFFEDNEKSTLAATREFFRDGSCHTVFFDEKGNKIGEGKEVNKLKEGEWKFYHPGFKTVMTLENYSKGKLTGIRKTFYPDGKIAEEATYSNGLKNGPYKKYTQPGIVLEESVYKNNDLHGPVTYRNSEGEVVTKGHFANNKQTGVWEFFEKGKLVKKEDRTNKKVQLSRKERKN
ncbi:MAG TPA: hypothetical protein VEA37_07780 [Flavobacterium sp.]|nr:hypothetical protein [Flavobacterium sp.]